MFGDWWGFVFGDEYVVGEGGVVGDEVYYE